MTVFFPRVWALDERRARNQVRQLAERPRLATGTIAPFARSRLRGFLFSDAETSEETLIVPKAAELPDSYSRVLLAALSGGRDYDLGDAVWLRHPCQHVGTFDHALELQRVLDSWKAGFVFAREDTAAGTPGLRPPQIGAIHAVHAHWSVSGAPATIVMPTGTGKTETMLSVLVSYPCQRVLVVVPTDALREQIAAKFMTLGVLKNPGFPALAERALYPVVGVLQHIPRSVSEVDDVFCRCHVVITTSSVAGQCDPAVQDRMALRCPFLFIDEAHHVEAPTWSAFKRRFGGCRVLQFTATPFREDGKPLDGEIIFRYPLRKAQEDGYFTRIRFRPVVEFDRKQSDRAIAAAAIDQLRTDRDRGHILLARVSGVARAQEVFEIYKEYPEFQPVELHTGISSARERKRIRQQIISGASRIVICVDMLGEGFDLPELKIAAFHDIRKSLSVTLQLAGRFTRARNDLGDATFIANTADVQVQDELRKLYSREPDWNALLPELSEQMVGEQLSLQQFLRGFTAFADEIPLKTVRPAISAVVYRTRCEQWTPHEFRRGIPGVSGCEQVHYAVNEEERTLIVVTARRVPLDWTDVEQLFSWQWELYVLLWSPDQQLLYINCSSNAGEYKGLAQAVAGSDVTLVNGQTVFRTFAGVNRLRLQNVGLTEQLGRNVRYTGRMGADVEPALTDLQRQRATKSVLSGTGYENGARVTVGASKNGRIWSHRRDRVNELVAWCKQVGLKLLDQNINPEEVLKGTLVATAVTERPEKMPIGADWPEDIYRTPEGMWTFVIDGREFGLSEADISVPNPALTGPLRIRIGTEEDSLEVELQLLQVEGGSDYRYVVCGDHTAQVTRGVSRQSLESFLYNSPPVIWFADGSALEGNQYVQLRDDVPPYDQTRIAAWDWAGVDIRKESQGPTKAADSIQARVIRELTAGDYSVIFDDDDSGEAADVVAIRVVGTVPADRRIEVEFYHCKYSQADSPGQRIKDLYEVCGQAQKSVRWMLSPESRTDLFTHLMRRDAQRRVKGLPTRIERGGTDVLQTIVEMSRLCPVSLRIAIVQPGVSKSDVSADQLRLLGVTANYLYETYQLPLIVIASP